jgi:hypothetical protein
VQICIPGVVNGEVVDGDHGQAHRRLQETGMTRPCPVALARTETERME